MKVKTQDVLNKDRLTNQEILLLCKRANAGEEIDFNDKEFLITSEQTQKGLDWLNDQRRTPTGKERKNNPFGAREEEVLDNFDYFTFDGLINAGNSFVDFYLPIYTVVGKNHLTFQYYVSGGKINIIG